MAPPVSRILESKCALSTAPGTVYVETERLILRRYLCTDAPAIVASANFPEVAKSLSDNFPSPYTLADAEALVARCEQDTETPYPTQIAICMKPNTKDNSSPEELLIGNIGVRHLDNIFYRTWSLGYYVTPAQWGKGYMTEAIRAVSSWMLSNWPRLSRIEAGAYSSNPGSMAVLRNCGFVLEGVKRDVAEKDGVLLDVAVYGLVRGDAEKKKTCSGLE